jgi:hypothetical protein
MLLDQFPKDRLLAAEVSPCAENAPWLRVAWCRPTTPPMTAAPSQRPMDHLQARPGHDPHAA